MSVLDSVVQGGDAVWEGLRVSDGRIYQMDEHLKRLVDSAHALQFADTPCGRGSAGRLQCAQRKRHDRRRAHPFRHLAAE